MGHSFFFKGVPGQNSINSLSAYPDLLKFLADQSHLHLGGPLILLAPQLIASNLKGTIQPIHALCWGGFVGPFQLRVGIQKVEKNLLKLETKMSRSTVFGFFFFEVL